MEAGQTLPEVPSGSGIGSAGRLPIDERGHEGHRIAVDGLELLAEVSGRIVSGDHPRRSAAA